MNESYSVRLPWPPSANGFWRSTGNRTYLTKQGKQFRTDAIDAIKDTLGSFDTIEERVMVSIELTPPDKRKRDIDNHCKATLDALEHSGLLANDEQIDLLRVARLVPCAPGCCDVTVTVI